MEEGELGVIEAQQVKNFGVKTLDRVHHFHGLAAYFISRTDIAPGLHE